MATEAMVEVGYEGKKYMIPAEIARLNATQPGVARDYIENEIEEQVLREQQKKQRHEASVEAEFESISAKLEKVDGIEQTLAQQQQTIESYRSANEALNAQVAALEESGGVLGGANATARQTSFELSNQATSGAAVLAEMQRTEERLNATIETMQAQLDELQLEFARVITEGLTTGRNQQRLQQEASNRALSEAAKAEEIARKAEAVAGEAMSKAQSAQIISKNDLTRDQLVSIVQDELRASSPRLVDEAIEVIRADEFHGGSVTGQRHDPALTRQRRADADAARNIR